MGKGAPKGNQYALGNRGGGRRSLYEERQDVLWHEDVWKNQQDIDALIERIRGRKYAGRDIAALKLLQGDKYLIGKFMDKLIPNLQRNVDKDGNDLPVPILGFIHALPSNDSNKENTGIEETD